MVQASDSPEGGKGDKQEDNDRKDEAPVAAVLGGSPPSPSEPESAASDKEDTRPSKDLDDERQHADTFDRESVLFPSVEGGEATLKYIGGSSLQTSVQLRLCVMGPTNRTLQRFDQQSSCSNPYD